MYDAVSTQVITNSRQSLDPGFSLGLNDCVWHVKKKNINCVAPNVGGEYAVCSIQTQREE